MSIAATTKLSLVLDQDIDLEDSDIVVLVGSFYITLSKVDGRYWNRRQGVPECVYDAKVSVTAPATVVIGIIKEGYYPDPSGSSVCSTFVRPAIEGPRPAVLAGTGKEQVNDSYMYAIVGAGAPNCVAATIRPPAPGGVERAVRYQPNANLLLSNRHMSVEFASYYTLRDRLVLKPLTATGIMPSYPILGTLYSTYYVNGYTIPCRHMQYHDDFLTIADYSDTPTASANSTHPHVVQQDNNYRRDIEAPALYRYVDSRQIVFEYRGSIYTAFRAIADESYCLAVFNRTYHRWDVRVQHDSLRRLQNFPYLDSSGHVCWSSYRYTYDMDGATLITQQPRQLSVSIAGNLYGDVASDITRIQAYNFNTGTTEQVLKPLSGITLPFRREGWTPYIDNSNYLLIGMSNQRNASSPSYPYTYGESAALYGPGLGSTAASFTIPPPAEVGSDITMGSSAWLSDGYIRRVYSKAYMPVASQTRMVDIIDVATRARVAYGELSKPTDIEFEYAPCAYLDGELIY